MTRKTYEPLPAEWWQPFDTYTPAMQVGIERRMTKRYDPPANVTNLETERAKRTAGGKTSWSMKQDAPAAVKGGKA
jgi:hypothetical protein